MWNGEVNEEQGDKCETKANALFLDISTPILEHILTTFPGEVLAAMHQLRSTEENHIVCI